MNGLNAVRRNADLPLGMFFFYVVSIGILDIFDFPLVGVKVQLPELVFIGLVMVLIVRGAGIKAGQFILTSADKMALFFWIACGLSSFYVAKWGSLLEWVGLGYLLLMSGLLSNWLERQHSESWLAIVQAVVVLGILSAVAGIVGWIGLACFGYPNRLADWYERYPYLGDTIRASGFCAGSSLLAMVLEMVVLVYAPFVIIGKKIFRWDIPIMGLLLCGYLLTFGKSLIPGIGGFVWLINAHKKYLSGRKAAWLFTGLLTVYFVGTQVLVYHQSRVDELLGKERFVSDAPVCQVGSYIWVPTTYWELKKGGLALSRIFFPMGVGSGEFFRYSELLKAAEILPKHLPPYDPHSTFIGAFAETGFFSGLLLIGFAGVLARCLQQLMGLYKLSTYPLLWGLGLYFLVTVVEALSSDVLFFRHFWVSYALLGAIFRREIRFPGGGNPF